MDGRGADNAGVARPRPLYVALVEAQESTEFHGVICWLRNEAEKKEKKERKQKPVVEGLGGGT